MSHRQVSTKVNAKVDEGISRLITAMSQFTENVEKSLCKKCREHGDRNYAVHGKVSFENNERMSGFSQASNDAKISLVVFLEHGGKGGLEPCEIAKEIFEEARRRGYL